MSVVYRMPTRVSAHLRIPISFCASILVIYKELCFTSFCASILRIFLPLSVSFFLCVHGYSNGKTNDYIKRLISSSNTFTDIHRNSILPAICTFLCLVKLTHSVSIRVGNFDGSPKCMYGFFNISIPGPLGELCREGRLEIGCFSELLVIS